MTPTEILELIEAETTLMDDALDAARSADVPSERYSHLAVAQEQAFAIIEHIGVLRLDENRQHRRAELGLADDVAQLAETYRSVVLETEREIIEITKQATFA